MNKVVNKKNCVLLILTMIICMISAVPTMASPTLNVDVSYYYVETNSGETGHINSVYEPATKRGNYLVNVNSISANDGIEAWKVSRFSDGKAVFEIQSADGNRSQTMKYASHDCETGSWTGPNFWDASGQIFIMYYQVKGSNIANFNYGYHGNCVDSDAIPISNDPFFKNNTGSSLFLYDLNQEQYNELSRQLVSCKAQPSNVIDPPPYIKINRRDGIRDFGKYSSLGIDICKGQNYTQNPINENGRLLVPLRQFAEALGYEVTWNNEDRSISMKDDSHNVWMQVDNMLASKNGSKVTLDVPPRLVNGTTMIPLRFVAEAAGYSIDSFHGGSNVYFISYYDYLSSNEMQGLFDMESRDRSIYTTPAGICIGDSLSKVIDTYGIPEDDGKKDNDPYPEIYTGSFNYKEWEPFQSGGTLLVIDIKNGCVSRMYLAN